MRRLVYAFAPLWSLVYLALGVAWLAGAGGNPTDPAVDVHARNGLLGIAGPTAGAAILAVLGAAGLLASALLLRRGHTPGRAAVGLAVVLGLLLCVVLPDYRVLAHVAYTPIVAVLLVFDAVPDDAELWPWPVASMGLMSLAGLALLLRAADVLRAGRDSRPIDAASLARWRRRGRWAVAVAVVVPVAYAATRFAWALGIPLGMPDWFLDDLGSARYAGAALGALGIGGAVLTLGLVQRWGEVFPRWLPLLRGRPVPIGLATVPSRIVAVIVTSAGLLYVRLALTGAFGEDFGAAWYSAATLPELLWPLWGAALAVASYAYEVRRRASLPIDGHDERASSTTPA